MFFFGLVRLFWLNYRSMEFYVWCFDYDYDYMIVYFRPSQCDTTMVSFESHYKKKKNILRRKWGSRIHGRTTKGCIVKSKRETTGRLLSVSSSMIVFLLILFWRRMYDERCVFEYHSIYHIQEEEKDGFQISSCVRNIEKDGLHYIVVTPLQNHAMRCSIL